MKFSKKIDERIESLVGKTVTREELESLVSMRVPKAKVVPTEIDIPVDQVVKRYAISDAWEIARCKTAIFFHSNSFWVVSRPTLANNMKGGALYEMLSWWCDYQDNPEEYSGEERETYDVLVQMIVHILSLPLDVFTDMQFCIDIAQDVMSRRSEYYQRILAEQEEREETESDLIENAAFEERMRFGEELNKDLEKLNANKARRKKMS